MIPRRALTIAGSDSGGGAGIQADLKTFAACGVYGLSVVTALTAQNTFGVQAVHELPPDFVAAQLRSVLADIGADAVKTGMLANAGVVEVVADVLEEFRVSVPLVVDPVMAAKSGDRLLSDDAVSTLVRRLFPRSALVTPNAVEASMLTGLAVEDFAGMEEAAKAILDLGAGAALIKGGHLGGLESDDYLAISGGEAVWLRAQRLEQRHTHGTGCTLSAAITARLARGESLIAACRAAKDYLTGAIRTAVPLGSGIGPVNHLWERDFGDQTGVMTDNA